MIEQICDFIHNYFVHAYIEGTFTISDGTIELPELMEGQYFCIRGSRFNDGVYQYPVLDLADEVFTGTIWEMRPPRAFLQLVAEIETWQEKYGEIVNTPYQSESFGGYSYSKASGSAGSSDTDGAGWQGVFKHRLNAWRKLA